MTTDTLKANVPSVKALVTATLVALVVATTILVAFVLPAEYGIDPLHTGRALGLTALASANEPATKPQTVGPAPSAAVEQSQTFVINPVLVPSPTGEAPTVKDTFIAQPARFQFDSRDITLASGEGMEIKYDMKRGAGLVYSWTADAPLKFEFHGEPNVKPQGKEGTDYYESYELDDKRGRDHGYGTFVAPSTGIHGWFWENTSGKPVKLKLASSGFFDWIMQNRKNKHTALKPQDAFTLPGHPQVPDEAVR